MSIKNRLVRLETRRVTDRFASIPFSVLDGDPEGAVIEGEFLTWDEIERKYPEAPLPMRWDEE